MILSISKKILHKNGTKMNSFTNIQQLNSNIVNKIGTAERKQDFDEVAKLKRELYNNKLKMLDLLEFEEKKYSISAKDLIYKVEHMPIAIRYETGLHYLDSNLKQNEHEIGGIEVGNLILLGGSPGAGKTHILLELLANVSKYAKCVFFNFEMGDRRIVKRLNRLLTEPQQFENFTINSESRELSDLLMEITLLSKEGIKFFAIDSRMKINVKGNEQEYQKNSSITKSLSEVAIKNDIIIVLINQISEDNLKTNTLAFKGSGDQLYDADIALFLVVEKDETRTLICKKNRQDEHLFVEHLPPVETNTFYQNNIGKYVANPKVIETEYIVPKTEMSIL